MRTITLIFSDISSEHLLFLCNELCKNVDQLNEEKPGDLPITLIIDGTQANPAFPYDVVATQLFQPQFGGRIEHTLKENKNGNQT